MLGKLRGYHLTHSDNGSQTHVPVQRLTDKLELQSSCQATMKANAGLPLQEPCCSDVHMA